MQGKKILFIAPIFHDYHRLIIQKLEEQGAVVVFAPERDYSACFKVVNNFFNRFLPYKQVRHYRKILQRIRGEKFDYLFVIRGYMLTEEFVIKFKADNPYAKTVMYQWDSNRTNPFSEVIPLFDIVKSFDYEDCEELHLEYLPLFYTEDVAAEAEKPHPIKYDFFFMGTYMPERYEAVLKFRDSLKDRARLKAFIYIAPTSLKKEHLKGVKLDMSIVSTEHMPREQYLRLLNQSRVVVDVSNPRQTGLAMRIIEALASRRKILTVNRFIETDPYYNLNNIAIFDPAAPRFNEDFVTSPFVDHPNEVLSIKRWLNKALDL